MNTKKRFAEEQIIPILKAPLRGSKFAAMLDI